MSHTFIGLMSGTSLDGVDAVLVDFSKPLPVMIASYEHPIPPDIKDSILSVFNHCQSVSLDTIGKLDQQFAKLSAEACLILCEKANLTPRDISAIGSHGLTLRHSPNIAHPFTWQIGDPNIITETTQITTIADFRRRDMAAGGQGAPLVPAFHNAVFRSSEEDRAILNIGGIANFTILPKNTQTPVLGFDTGPGNGLMDIWIQHHQHESFDQNGAWAHSGRVDPNLLNKLLADDYFKKEIPKSTGREHFNLSWIQRQIDNEHPADIQATLAELTAQTITHALQQWAPNTQRVLVCGGGTHNSYLLEQIKSLLGGIILESTEQYGFSPDWVEATAFAWLAKQTLNKNAGNMSSVTGASGPRILGGIYFA